MSQAGRLPMSKEVLFTSVGPPELEAEYIGLTDDLSAFLDALAGARVTAEEIAGMRGALQTWTHRLAQDQVGELERQWGHWPPHPGRGQTLVPAYVEDSVDDRQVRGRVTFGRQYVGENMAAHGGAVALLFDDVLGRLANRAEGGPARTAFLEVNFRAITPIGVELHLDARVAKVEGRKRFLEATLTSGDIVCADAEGLWLELRVGHG